MPRGGGVGADRQPERLVRIALGAQHLGRRALCARRQDGHRRSEASRHQRRTPIDAAAVEHRQRLAVETNLGSGLDGDVDEVRVEAAARPDRAVVREPVGGGPGQLAGRLPGDHPQPIDAVGVGHVDLQLLQRTDGRASARRRTPCRDRAAPSRTPRPTRPTRRPIAAAAPAGPPPITATSTDSEPSAPPRGERAPIQVRRGAPRGVRERGPNRSIRCADYTDQNSRVDRLDGSDHGRARLRPMGGLTFDGERPADPVGESVRLFVAEMLDTARVRMSYHPVGEPAAPTKRGRTRWSSPRRRPRSSAA